MKFLSFPNGIGCTTPGRHASRLNGLFFNAVDAESRGAEHVAGSYFLVKLNPKFCTVSIVVPLKTQDSRLKTMDSTVSQADFL